MITPEREARRRYSYAVPPTDRQRVLWRQLDTLLAQRAPTIFKTLNGPACASALEQLSTRGANEELIASYAVHDGARYQRIARGGGATAVLPTLAGVAWTRATRWLDVEELVSETSRLGGRVALAAGHVVVARLFEPFRRMAEYDSETQSTVIVSATGELFASEDWPWSDAPAKLTPLGTTWLAYLERLRTVLEAKWVEERDAEFLRLVDPPTETTGGRASPAARLIAALSEQGIIAGVAKPRPELLAEVDRALRRRGIAAQAKDVMRALRDARDVELSCLDEELLEKLL